MGTIIEFDDIEEKDEDFSLGDVLGETPISELSSDDIDSVDETDEEFADGMEDNGEDEIDTDLGYEDTDPDEGNNNFYNDDEVNDESE